MTFCTIVTLVCTADDDKRAAHRCVFVAQHLRILLVNFLAFLVALFPPCLFEASFRYGK